jgi:hypothetical protein
VVLARAALAAALLVQGRVDLARPHVDDALACLPLVAADRLVEVGEGLVGMAAAAWLPDAMELVVALHAQLVRIARRTADTDLDVLTDAVGCVATIAAGRPEEAVRDAERVHARAEAAGNIMAGWFAAGPPMIAAVLAGRPEQGIPWVNRLMRGHMRLGTGGGGLCIENRANLAAQAGDYGAAARFYAAARTETRRAAIVWPRRPLTLQLLDLTRRRLGRTDYERAWQEGERLTLPDIVGPA